jgi:ABC-type xylose transport system permease subunit
MKKGLGFLIILVGLFTGLYVGIWWGFIGGIVKVIEVLKSTELVSMDLALGIARIVFASTLGTIAGYLVALPGFLMLSK